MDPDHQGLATGESNGSYARILREDPKRPGLLFLGTESAMYVSFDDGDSWQSLMLNLPTTSSTTRTSRSQYRGTAGRALGVFSQDARVAAVGLAGGEALGDEGPRLSVIARAIDYGL